ncbi:MAG: Rieske 2Fe-2S domain-containing protein [Bryobacterales bacterium]|nr:Rieske 2Fe-2S domain-containing protein [Bryobacterales bacterium]
MDLTGYRATGDVARATTIPASWYTDPRMLELERRRVFEGTWQAVGHAQQVAARGSYFAADVAGEPIVVARTAGGELCAYSNVCRHRASLVASGCGKASVLRCPYHGWSYRLDGRLHAAPEFDGVEDWDSSQVCLPRMRVEVWGPFVFVNANGEAPPLGEVMGSIPEEVAGLGCPVEQLHFSARRDYVIECNWKVYVDNYLEGYHLPAAHPGLFRELDYGQYKVETFRWYSSQYAPIRAAREGEKRQYDAPLADNRALYFWIFPNFMLNVYPDNLSSNIIVPLGHDRTLTIFEWFTYPGENGPAEVKPETIAFSDEIQQEDIRICESVQRGLRSSFYDKGRFSARRENGVHHFHLLLDEALR